MEGTLRLSPALTLRAHLTRLVSRIAGSDEPLRQRPARRGGVQLAWSHDGTSTISWRAEYAAHTFDSSIPTGSLVLPTYLRHDLVYRRRLSGSSEMLLALDNVANKSNATYVGAPGPARRFRLTLNSAL